jgi:hypothetical protein
VAIFNLANSYYQLEKYGDAVELYMEVLRYEKEQHAALVNLEFARKMDEKARDEKDNPVVGREGRGSRKGNMARDQESAHLNLSIDNNESGQKPASGVSENKLLDESELVDQSIYHSRPVVGKIIKYDDKDWRYTATTVAGVVLELNALTIDESIVWKRIFEGEEGFPAPKDSPETLPGILPW